MEYLFFDKPCYRVEAGISFFRGMRGAGEYHITLQALEPGALDVQYGNIFRAYMDILAFLDVDINTSVFRRFFCSDLTNQTEIIERLPLSGPAALGAPCNISLVCQPPGYSAKIAMWAYHICDRESPLEKSGGGDLLALKRGGITHYWNSGITSAFPDSSYMQSGCILGKYNNFLRSKGMSLADNVIRTWFFLQNIDADYKGFVVARKEFFASHGLTEKTHFISSTAVGGSHSDVAVKVTMDAYSISGLLPGQIRFLSAPEYLSPTSLYGVTFERGASVAYSDRKHIFLSGTASIDSKGNIMHLNDVRRQIDRALENIEALLAVEGAGLADIGIFIAYVRDPADYGIVSKNLLQRFRQVPAITVLAPVCRPGWLFEIEGIAVIPSSAAYLPEF